MSDIIKRFKKTLDKSVATVSVKSNAMIEINKIKVHMNSLAEKIISKKQELGDTVYTMYVANNPDQDVIEAICEEIVVLNQQYNEKGEEIERVKQEEIEILGTDKKERRCECNQVIPDGYSFCTHCGKKVE